MGRVLNFLSPLDLAWYSFCSFLTYLKHKPTLAVLSSFSLSDRSSSTCWCVVNPHLHRELDQPLSPTLCTGWLRFLRISASPIILDAVCAATASVKCWTVNFCWRNGPQRTGDSVSIPSSLVGEQIRTVIARRDWRTRDIFSSYSRKPASTIIYSW